MAESNQMSGGSEKLREYEKKAVNMKGNSGLLGLTHDHTMHPYGAFHPRDQTCTRTSPLSHPIPKL